MASWSLGSYVALLSERLGYHSSHSISDAAVGPDPTRWAIARGATTGLRKDGGSPEEYIGRWLYVSSGTAIGQQRRVTDAVMGFGGLVMGQPFSTTLAANDQFTLTWPLPLTTWNGVTGLKEIVVNQAMRDLWFEDTLDLTTVSLQREYSLSTYAAWLTRRDQFIRVLDPREIRASGSPFEPSIFPWHIKFGNGTPYLVAGDERQTSRGYYSGGLAFQAVVRRPVWSRVTGAESPAGPTSLTDTLQADLTDVVDVALKHAYRYLSTWPELPAAERERYAGLAEQQAAHCRTLAAYDPHDGKLAEAA